MTSHPCKVCSKNLAPSGEYVTCAQCSGKLHYDDCSGISQATWKAKSANKKKEWCCKNCRTPTQNGSSSSHNGDGDRDKDRDNWLLSRIEDIINSKLLSVNSQLEIISNNSKEIIDRIVNLELENAKLWDENRLLSDDNEKLRKRMYNIEFEVEAQAQYSRRNNVVIRGVPLEKEEKPVDLAKKIGSVCGLNLNNSDVDACHRLPSKDKSAPPFIMKFVSRLKKDEFLKSWKSKKPKQSAFGGDENKKVFAEEHLTAFTADLLKETRKLYNHGYKYIWTKDCSIFIRRNEKSPVAKVNNFSQLDSILAAESTTSQEAPSP